MEKEREIQKAYERDPRQPKTIKKKILNWVLIM